MILRPHRNLALEALKIESWKPVVGYEGRYEVSDLGNVRSLPRQIEKMNRWGKLSTLSWPGRTLVLIPGEYGRIEVKLSKDGDAKTRLVHQLVLEAFVGPRPAGMEVAHWDGDASHNYLQNLRYATPMENTEDKRRHGTVLRGVGIRTSKLSTEDAIKIRKARGAVRVEDTAAEFKISIAQVSRIQTGKRWAHLEGEI